MKFPKKGKYLISGALKPVSFDLEQDVGIYIEPNVWVKHNFGTLE